MSSDKTPADSLGEMNSSSSTARGSLDSSGKEKETSKFGRAFSTPDDPTDRMRDVAEHLQQVHFPDTIEEVNHRPVPRKQQAINRNSNTSWFVMQDGCFLHICDLWSIFGANLMYELNHSGSKKGQNAPHKWKVRSLYGVSPNCKFGPKGFLLDCTSSFLKIPDPSSQKLNWTKPPLSVLVIKKPLDISVTVAFRDLVIWLIEEKNMVVYVEEKVVSDETLVMDSDFDRVQNKLQRFKEGKDDLEDKVDFIICMGGDGTLLYASSLFQQSVPPVVAFNMGSLGFLTPFPFSMFKDRINQILGGQTPLLLRYRLKCVMHNQDAKMAVPHVKNIDKKTPHISAHILVLNEVVIDRGPSSYLCNLDLYIEGRLVTSVLGDGLIISTPTGSTAYSVAAGASMIHPNVPCILITPICPHSLSFRPIVVPAGVEIKVTLAPEARGSAMVSFDGRNRQEIQQGVSLKITTASYPVPSICARDQIEDWFDGLADCLHWNVRRPQKPLSSSASLNSLDSVDFEVSKWNSQYI